MFDITKLNRDSVIRFYEKYMILMGSAGHLIYVFQTHKILVNHCANDVSLEGFFVSFLSIISWFFYGVLKNDMVLVKVNVFGLITSTICLIAITYFKYFAS